MANQSVNFIIGTTDRQIIQHKINKYWNCWHRSRIWIQWYPHRISGWGKVL